MYQHEEFDNYPAYHSVSAIYHKFLEVENIELGEYEARESAYRKTLQHVEAVFGEPSEQCAAAHYYLANFYQGNYDIFEAVAHWEKVLVIEETIFGPLSEDYCNTLNNLGIALTDNYQLLPGESFLRLALTISAHKNYHEKGHAEFQLARSLEENYKTGRLVAWFRRITVIATSNELKGKAYHSLAELYKNVCGDFQSAENSFRLAIDYLRNSNDKEQLANALYNYSSFLLYRDRLDEAETYLREGLKVQSALETKDSEDNTADLEMIYRLLIRLSLKKGDDDQLLDWIEHLLALTEQSANLDLDVVLDRINVILREHGDIDKRYQILMKIAHNFPCVQTKLHLAYCARDTGAVNEAKTILMDIPPEALSAADRQELFLFLLDQGDLAEADKLNTELINDPQLLLLLKIAALEKEPSLSDEVVKNLVRSLLFNTPS